MTAEPKPEVSKWALADDGSRTPFHGDGFRIPLGASWVKVDFRFDHWPLQISFGTQAPRSPDRELPELLLRPLAGNKFTVRIGHTPLGDAPIEVVPVGAER